MAKGNNNLRSKKPHSSKPYDVSNSFVKKVTSGVSSLLPQSSWLSRWFASSSTPEEDKPSTSDDGDNHGEEQDTQSPPCKRARIPLNRPFPANSFRVSSPIDRGETHPWPSESVASPIPNVFSDSAVPGPSGLARTPIASSTFQSPNPNTEALEGKINGDGGSDSSESTSGCSSLAPQRVTPSTSSAVHKTPVSQKLANHSQFSLFPSATHKLSPTINSSLNRRRPSFNVSSFGSPNLDSSKLSRETSLNSPFYIGRTMYGGASAYRRPREGVSSESLMSSSRRGGVTLRPANEKTQSGSSAEATMSQTARRILEALEQFSSPVSEARRMPLPPQPPLSAKRKRTLDMTSPVKSANPPAAALNPLTIPMPPERLRLHRLQDATEAARRVASSRSNASGNYSLRTDNETILHKEPGKVTKSKPLDEDERVLPVNLPNIPLAITTLPSFDLFSSPAQSIPSSNIRTNVSLTTAKPATKSDQTCVSAEIENSKVSSGTSSSVASLSTSSKVDTVVATTSSGMNPISFMPIKSSSKMTNFKFTADNSDTFQTNCIRKSDNISSKLSSSNKLNSKTVSFSDSVSCSPFSNISTSSANNTKSNEFVFSTPKVLPTANFKETTESKVNSFYFCKPEVLELTKCDNKVNREEPNGFRKHSSKSGDSTDISLLQKSVNKEVSEKSDANTESLCVSGNSKLKLANPIENNGWGAKFVLPESWECSSCMVRNKKDIEVCVCCGGEKPKPASTVVSNDLTVNTGQSGSLPIAGWGKKFQLQPDMWECSICLVRNKETESNCVSCTSARCANNKSKQKDSQAGSWGSQFKMSSDLWECTECFVRNKQQDVQCISCTTPRSTSGKNGDVKSGSVETKKSGNDWGQKFKKSADNWECPVCMIQNKESLLKCAACEEPKPGLDKNRVGTGSSIKFNFEIPSSASSFKFGIDQADVKPSEVSTPTSFQFGSGKPDTTSTGQNKFSFGKSETKISSGFTFGIPQSVSSSSSVSTSSAPSKSDESTIQPPNKVSVNSPATSFAPAKSSESPKAGGFTFGVASTTVSASFSGDSTKAVTNKSGSSGNSSSEKDVKFGVSHASPVALNSGNKNTTVTSVSKSGQSSSTDNKTPSFNFTAPSKPAAFNFTANLTSTTNTLPVTTSLSVAPTAPANNSESTTAVTSTSSIFSFGGSNSQSSFSKPSVSSSPSFAFKDSGSQPSPGSIFATASQSQFKAPGDGLFSTKTPVSTSIPAFENPSNTLPKTTSVQSFGAATTTAATPTATTTTSVPSFTTAHATVFATLNKSSSEFGNCSTKPIFANASNSFGPITTTATVNTPVSTPSVSSTSGATPNFVVPTTASFGVHVTTVGASVTSPTFGTTAASTNFGLPTSAVVATSNSSSFGTSAPVKFGTPATTSNNFGVTSAPSTFNTTASSIFGSSNTPTFGTSTTPGFGSNSVTPNFGSSFSTVTTTAPAFGAPSPAVSTVSTTPSVQVFGGFSNPAKPAQGLFLFGSSPATTTPGSNFTFSSPAQTAATQPTGSSTPVFGFGSANATNVTSSTTTTPTASAAPAAAAAAAAPAPGFGGFSFTPATGTPAPSSSGLFSNNTVSVFGSPATSTPSATGFGAGSTASSTVFRPQSFNFGSGGTQQPFSFGSGAQSGANQAGSNTTFSFGQSQVPAQSQPLLFNPNVRPSFNFTGGETPQFTASAPSATPTPPRRVKKAVRRTQRQ